MSAIANGGTLFGAEPKVETVVNVNGDNSLELTVDEYNALSEEEKTNGTTYYITDGVASDIEKISANNIEYDNSTSGLSSTTVQDSVDEINNNLSSTLKILFDEENFKIYISHNKYNVSLFILCSTKETYTRGWHTLCTLPEELRPTKTMPFTMWDNYKYIDGYAYAIAARIISDGSVQIYAFTDSVEMSPFGSISYCL